MRRKDVAELKPPRHGPRGRYPPARLMNAMRLAAFALLLSLPLAAYEPTKENLEAREWFQDAKFGLFIHWGVYATLAKGEWVMQNDKMSIPEYERYAGLFNPIKFDAKQWVAMVKAAQPNAAMNVAEMVTVRKNSAVLTVPMVLRGLLPCTSRLEVTIAPQPPPPAASRKPPTSPSGETTLGRFSVCRCITPR